jgi:membrane protein YqaA with SNARE-associated domain
MIYKILWVAFLSTFEIYAAIASGLAFKLSPNIICITTLVGGFTGVFIAAFLGEKIKQFVAKYKKPKPPRENSSKDQLMRKLWDLYGVIGIGFVGTLIIGAPASIGIGYSFGVHPKQLLKWCLIAVFIRSIVYSYFFHFIVHLF